MADPPTPSTSENPNIAAMTEGLADVLLPTVNEIDDRIKQAKQSQVNLKVQIDTLSESLRVITDESAAPYDLDVYVKKLQDSKKRIAVVSSILTSAQDRLQRLHSNIAKETAKKKSALDPPTPSPPGE